MLANRFTARSQQRPRALNGGRKTTLRVVQCSAKAAVQEEKLIKPGVYEGYWTWEGHKIRYQRSGDAGTPVVLVHGFGGNADHWRKNTPELGALGHRAYAIDLLGYGFSSKPNPRAAPPNSIYNFETWGRQLAAFLAEVVQDDAVLSANSVGGLAALQAAIDTAGASTSSGSSEGASSGSGGSGTTGVTPPRVLGVQLLNISLRGLHVERQSPLARPLVAALQRFLRDTPAGRAFFGSVATPKGVEGALSQCYCDKSAVTDELVDAILRPGLEPGAVDVFLDFISYSGGPLPERLIERCPVPVSILWGRDDPWEPLAQARALLAPLPAVAEFVELPGVGHCPQDEAPALVNPRIAAFAAACRANGGALAAKQQAAAVVSQP